jgi:sugar transferase EpsL
MRPLREGEVFYLNDEARLTRVGRFLHSTSIDELPEVWAVLRGDMSLVGPRPLIPSTSRGTRPTRCAARTLKPGITGRAQVNGRQALQFSERIALDLWYVTTSAWPWTPGSSRGPWCT